MSMNKIYPVRNYLPASILLAAGGWFGLAMLVRSTLPTLGPRWMFFFLLVSAITGTAMPLIAYLNQRFPARSPHTHRTVVRESLMAGTYVATLAWLQLGRALTPALAFLLALGLGGVEWLVRLREQSQWQP